MQALTWIPIHSFKHCRAPILYYLSTWDRVILKKDHSRCGSSRSCQAHQLNPKTYATQHAAGCLGCQEHGLSSETISSFLVPDKTVVPLVTVDSRRLDSPIEAVAADISRVESVLSYVAISHVWSDGKGNPHRNYLPLCQLQRLQDCTNALYPSDQHPVPFWMDTLCVPVGKKFWPVRNRALNRMKSTYKSAEKILVFDTSLEIVDSSVAPEEALIRIRYSPWSSRLWTMQEGRLGLNLYFQFRDTSISFDNQPYQGGATGTLPAVEGILNSLSTLELVSTKCFFIFCYVPGANKVVFHRPVVPQPCFLSARWLTQIKACSCVFRTHKSPHKLTQMKKIYAYQPSNLSKISSLKIAYMKPGIL